ncbi:HAD hydrolase-like protein [Citricoccus sp. NPDC079358]|uniref:HAD-IIA family hydrolase n=1 Tax=Citricoccus sp. NPDC079358 TaxID=3154653 RepID=UPI0034500926
MTDSTFLPGFTPKPEAVTASRGWMLDVDGCLVSTSRAGGSGGLAMPGATALLEHLHGAGHSVVICTNASERTPAHYAEHLRSLGLDARDEDFITAGSAAAEYIAHHHPTATVLALGAEGITEPLTGLGLDLAEPQAARDGQLADVVLVGAQDSYTRDELNAACLAVDAGAPLYTTVASPWFHGGRGKSVALSSVVAHAIAWATGVDPQVLGKPSPALGETLQRHLGVEAGAITVVGDATAEIDLARAMGANAALVLSGATDAALLATLDGERRPDVALAGVADLLELLSPHSSPRPESPTSHPLPSEGARP